MFSNISADVSEVVFSTNGWLSCGPWDIVVICDSSDASMGVFDSESTKSPVVGRFTMDCIASIASLFFWLNLLDSNVVGREGMLVCGIFNANAFSAWGASCLEAAATFLNCDMLTHDPSLQITYNPRSSRSTTYRDLSSSNLATNTMGWLPILSSSSSILMCVSKSRDLGRAVDEVEDIMSRNDRGS